jgi:hypothetical protein
MSEPPEYKERPCCEPPFYITWALNNLLELVSCWYVCHRLGHLEFHSRRHRACSQRRRQERVANKYLGQLGPPFVHRKTGHTDKYILSLLMAVFDTFRLLNGSFLCSKDPLWQTALKNMSMVKWVAHNAPPQLQYSNEHIPRLHGRGANDLRNIYG